MYKSMPLAAVLLLWASQAWGAVPEAVDLLYRSINTTDLDRHLDLLDQAVKKDPRYFMARHNLGAALYRKGRIQDAVAELTHATALAGTYPNTHYLLACCYARLGKNDRAMKFLEKAASGGFAERQMLEADSDLDALRDAKGFKALALRVPLANGRQARGGKARRAKGTSAAGAPAGPGQGTGAAAAPPAPPPPAGVSKGAPAPAGGKKKKKGK